MLPLLSPIVCAARLRKERSYRVMGRFIQESGVDEAWCACMFVDSIDHTCDEASAAPMKSDSNPESPSIGETVQECHKMLLKLHRYTESEIITSCSMVMDKR
ncbi:unnamed protein product, partial [Aureobasidium vineae]